MVAYQVLGDGPFDLVYMSGPASHIDLRWESRRSKSFLDRLASFSRLILFDRRGSGASDPIPSDVRPTWEEWSQDLGAVLAAVGAEQPALFAVADAGPMAQMFAATYPERTRALILANTSARLLQAPDYPIGLTQEVAADYIALVEQSWGTEDIASLISPSVGEDLAWYGRYMRATGTPRHIAAQIRAYLSSDFRSALPLIQAPTLVLHNADFALIPPSHGRYLAEHIEGTQFVELPFAGAALIFDAADRALDAVERFLTGTVDVPAEPRMLATVVFTDVVDSTVRAAAVGDRRWRQLLEQHDRVTRHEVERHGGRIWQSTGDGAMAAFDIPGKAIRSMLGLRDGLTELGVPIRVGIHAGEVEVRDDDLSGLTVHIAARVLGQAGAGEVVVSRTVADLVAGSGLPLSDHGTHRLKGVPGEWTLFRVDA